MRLWGGESSLSQYPNVTFVGRRLQHFNFSAETTLDFNPKSDNEEAGLVIYRDANHHYKLSVKKENGKRELVLSYNIGKIKAIEKRVPLKSGPVKLVVSGIQAFFQFGFAQQDNQITKFDEVDTKYLSFETAGGFTGVNIGLFATGNGVKSKSAADFDNFMYKANGF